jgi:hypothetical protein
MGGRVSKSCRTKTQSSSAPIALAGTPRTTTESDALATLQTNCNGRERLPPSWLSTSQLIRVLGVAKTIQPVWIFTIPWARKRRQSRTRRLTVGARRRLWLRLPSASFSVLTAIVNCIATSEISSTGRADGFHPSGEGSSPSSRPNQDVSQPGRHPALEAGSRRFKSCRPDHAGEEGQRREVGGLHSSDQSATLPILLPRHGSYNRQNGCLLSSEF